MTVFLRMSSNRRDRLPETNVKTNRAFNRGAAILLAMNSGASDTSKGASVARRIPTPEPRTALVGLPPPYGWKVHPAGRFAGAVIKHREPDVIGREDFGWNWKIIAEL
jgi:hypothetical protein